MKITTVLYYHREFSPVTTMANSQNPSAIRDCDDRNSVDKFHGQITVKKIHELTNTNLKITSAKKLSFFAIK